MERSNKGLIVVLILIILGLAGYIIYDKIFYEEKCPKCEKCIDTCDVPIIKEEPLTLEEIGCQAFEELLKNNQTVSSYKINSCKLVEECDNTKERIVLGVNYDVTSPSEEQMWVIGNGEADEATLTVYGKENYVNVINENGNYKATLGATGAMLDSKTGKLDVCN